MIKLYTLQSGVKGTLGDVYQKDFALPKEVREITGITMDLQTQDIVYNPDYANAPISFGTASVSVNDNLLLTQNIRNANYMDGRGNLKTLKFKLDTPFVVAANSMIRFVIEEHLENSFMTPPNKVEYIAKFYIFYK